MPTPNGYVAAITPEQSLQIREILERKGWEFDTVPYARYRAKGEGATLISYESGKLVVQGKGTADFVTFVLEPEVLHTFTFGYEAELAAANEPPVSPHGGVDESGKGDFYGPLVIAGVYADAETGPALRAAGACDSKLIHSSKQIYEVAGKIRRIVEGRFAVVTLMPETYNRLYRQIGNLNRLLAWGHARVIENLLTAVPECLRMLSDKFANEILIRRALMERGRRVIMDQQVRAESDVAVAAASILAREGFLNGMKKLEAITGVELPRGAGPQVKVTGRKLLAEKGAEIFEKCAKLHFKTYGELTGRSL